MKEITTPQQLSNELRSNESFKPYWDGKGFCSFRMVPYDLLEEEYGITRADLEEIADTKFISQGEIRFYEDGFDIIVSV